MLKPAPGESLIAKCDQIIKGLNIADAETRLAMHVGVLEGQVKAMAIAASRPPVPAMMHGMDMVLRDVDTHAHFSLDDEGDVMLEAVYVGAIDILPLLLLKQTDELVDSINARRGQIDAEIEAYNTDYALWAREEVAA